MSGVGQDLRNYFGVDLTLEKVVDRVSVGFPNGAVFEANEDQVLRWPGGTMGFIEHAVARQGYLGPYLQEKHRACNCADPAAQQVTVGHVLEVLNGAVKTDPQAMRALIETRVPCNQALLDHPDIQVLTAPSGADHAGLVGFLGMLNGLFGKATMDGRGPIAAVFEVNCPACGTTVLELPEGAPCPVCGTPLVCGRLVEFRSSIGCRYNGSADLEACADTALEEPCPGELEMATAADFEGDPRPQRT